jgi:serine/threonine protein kinase
MKRLRASDPREIGRYRVLAEIGQGSVGRVLLSCGQGRQLVSIKQVHPQLSNDQGFRARFRQVVAASRTVVGTFIAPVIDADLDAPIPWLASVFVPGPSLHEAVKATDSLPEEAVLRLAAGLATALADVHRSCQPHRNLTPSNVLLAADGPRVSDVGIAQALDSVGGSALTDAGWLARSAGFMSPEQVEGREVTLASDMFSLGCVLMMAATGTSPFAGSSPPRTLHNVVHAEPDLSAIAERLRRIIQPCLAKDPADRPTPTQLVEMIGPLASDAQPWPPAVHNMIAAWHVEAGWYLDSGDQRTDHKAQPQPSPAAHQPMPPPPQRPHEPASRHRPWPPRLLSAATSSPRRRRLLIAAIAACLALAGVIGWWSWPPSGPHVVPGTVQASVMTPDEVSTVLGTMVMSGASAAEPPSPLSADPAECAVAVGPATQAVYARGLTVFGSVTYQDSDAVADHTVTQVLGVYPDTDKATAVFRSLTDGIKGCTSAVRTDADQNTSAWTYTVVDIPASDRLSWTATQDTGDGWACYRQARLKGKTVLQVAVCQAGDGRPAATKITDQFASKVSG